MRLFLENGFDATTVEQIVAAAGVSHMTFFRYFPTKEDVVDYDDYDHTLAERIAQRPSDEPPMEMIRQALTHDQSLSDPTALEAMLTRMRLVLSTPSLYGRCWAHKNADEHLIAHALATHPGHKADDLETRVIAAAAVAALTTAIQTWAQNDGQTGLRDLIHTAFTALTEAPRP